jgi:hypothetical protein
MPIRVVNCLDRKFGGLKAGRKTQQVDKSADNERALEFALLDSIDPQFFSLCVHVKELPVRKSDFWGRSDHVRLMRVEGQAELSAVTPRWIEVHIVAKGQFFKRQFLSDGWPQSRSLFEDKVHRLRSHQLIEQGDVNWIVHISETLLRTLKSVERSENCDTWTHNCAPGLGNYRQQK